MKFDAIENSVDGQIARHQEVPLIVHRKSVKYGCVSIERSKFEARYAK